MVEDGEHDIEKEMKYTPQNISINRLLFLTGFSLITNGQGSGYEKFYKNRKNKPRRLHAQRWIDSINLHRDELGAKHVAKSNHPKVANMIRQWEVLDFFSYQEPFVFPKKQNFINTLYLHIHNTMLGYPWRD